jgi:hypothetical protein
MTQYLGCKFRETDSRVYTYHNDGDLLSVGDVAKVADRSGDGWKRVFVVSVLANEAKPEFATKPILGRVDDEIAKEGII